MKVSSALALFFVVSMTMAAVGTVAGQQTSDPPAAPLPAAILTAKKLFISNASGETPTARCLPDLTYNGFYSQIKSWGRYELVSAPADADLVFEIRCMSSVGPVHVTRGEGNSEYGMYFRVSILDPKTRVVLWAFSEEIQTTIFGTINRKWFDESLSILVSDIKRLNDAASRAAYEQKK